jgi:hypothetical protein
MRAEEEMQEPESYPVDAPARIVYRATVEEVSQVDIALKVLPSSDGEEPITPRDGFDRIRVNVPGAANAGDVGAVLRAYGAVIGIDGAVRITIEPVGAR